jgi:hypothetical protein
VTMKTIILIVTACLALHASAVVAADSADKPWFVGVGDKPKGPLTAAAVEKLIAKGEINGDTLAWQDGMADWQPLSTIARFRALVVAPPPIPKTSSPPPIPATTPPQPQKAKPPPLPSTPPLVMTPPPIPSTPPSPRRVIGAPPPLSPSPSSSASSSSSPKASKRIHLIVAAPDDARAWAESRLAECKLSTGAVVGVIRVIRGVVSVSTATTSTSACVTRVLVSAMTNVGLADEEPFEIIVEPS